MFLHIQKWHPAIVFYIAISLLCKKDCIAQNSVYTTSGSDYFLNLTHDQLKNEHFALAAQSAREYLNSEKHELLAIKATDKENIKYNLVTACIKSQVEGWEDSALNMLETTKVPNYKQRIAYTLAQHYFLQDRLTEAIPYYETAGISSLSNEEIADEKFEMAYCYFNNKQFEKAEPLFSSMKELKEGKYYKAGNYYYGLLAYNENKYNAALVSFNIIVNDRQYKTVVPYYIAETYYFMGNKKKALEQALNSINKSEKSFYDVDFHLLAGQIYFEDQKYAEAKPLFEFYYDHSDQIRKVDLYKMAYCNYRLNEWDKAIEKFKSLSNAKDSLGQTAMYLLGDCYLKSKDKIGARNAFGLCADLNFNLGQQEASMMLYAMISFEMGYNDEASRQLTNLLTTFPETEYKDEANTLLSDLLIKTNNYIEALKHLDKVKKRDDSYRKSYQKATFGYAIQQFRKGILNSSFDYFNLSLQHPINIDYEAAALFWKGELAYRLGHFNDAITFSQSFLAKKITKEISHISPLATSQHACLNMGYAAMELKNYNEAQSYFNMAQKIQNGDNYSTQLANVLEADAVFLQKNFGKAIQLYNKIIATDSNNLDYATYQKSIILGLQNKHNDKIQLLQTLVNKQPTSLYNTQAQYEIAVTYLEQDKYSQALNYLLPLTDTGKDISYATKAYMKIGFIHQQNNNIEKAIAAYKKIVTSYPSSEDRIPALDALKNLYIQSNQPSSFAKLLKENNLPSSDSNSLDSTYYAAAEAQYTNGKIEAAKQAFSDYLTNYPNGIFAVKAYYYRAECNYQVQNYIEALSDYNKVLAKDWSDFSDNSTHHAAVIAYNNKDYTAAFNYYHSLRNHIYNNQTLETAYLGMIKSGYYCNKNTEVIAYSDSLLLMFGLSAESIDQGHLFKAKALQKTEKANDAIPIFKQLSTNKNGEIAAESRYHIAEIFLMQDSLAKAENAANETIKQSAGYDYWIVKSYILLSDLFVKQKDYFNAKATLESIVKHTKLNDIKLEAEQKLIEVKKLEKQKSKLSDDK